MDNLADSAVFAATQSNSMIKHLTVKVFTLMSVCAFSACLAVTSETALDNDLVHRAKDGTVSSVEIAFNITAVENSHDGALKISATGVLDGEAVGLALIVPLRWETHPMSKPGKVMNLFGTMFVRTGAPSDALDAVLRRLFKLEKSETLFKPSGYEAVTLATHDQLVQSKVELRLGDPAVEGETTWNNVMVLDLPQRTMRLTVFAPSW